MRRSVPIGANHDAVGAMGLGHGPTGAGVYGACMRADLQLHGPLEGALSGFVARVLTPHRIRALESRTYWSARSVIERVTVRSITR